MDLKSLNPRFGDPYADSATVLLERVRQWSERDAIRWLSRFLYYANAQDLLAELDTELAEIEAEVATLEATATIQSKKAAEARAEQDQAHRIAYHAQSAREKTPAQREEQAAAKQRVEAEMTAGRARKRIDELGKAMAPMYSLHRVLETVTPPELGAMPVVGELLAQLNQVQDDPPARRRGRKKRG
jgi:hypothetical protein